MFVERGMIDYLRGDREVKEHKSDDKRMVSFEEEEDLNE